MEKKHSFTESSLSYFIYLLCIYHLMHTGLGEEHRLQRRFMWKQVDNSMGTLMGRMFNSARVMKNIIHDLVPTQPTTIAFSSSMLDYLPTETTRIKYIIRNPHTNKSVKIIKLRPSSKKILNTKQIDIGPNSNFDLHLQDNDYKTRIRQLEKEKEMIAEGKFSILSNEAIHEKHVENYKKHLISETNENGSGKVHEYTNWKPVYRTNEKSNVLPTNKPYNMSLLYTDNTDNHELLTKPEKLSYNHEKDDHVENGIEKQMKHTYEVTEYVAEESASHEASLKVPTLNDFLPSYGISQQERDQVKNKQSTPITTKEPTLSMKEPNYSALFLKKYKDSEEKDYHVNRYKASEKQSPHLKKDSFQVIPQKDRNQSSKDLTYVTISPSATIFLQSSSEKRQEENQHKPKIYKSDLLPLISTSSNEHKSRNYRQRGTVKFSSKDNYEKYK